jgi:anti-sigma factor RsiW
METDELTCRELVELVTGYLDGSLQSDDRVRFERHLVDCPYCQAYLEQMRQVISLLGQITETSLDPDAENELLRCFRDWKQQSGRQ